MTVIIQYLEEFDSYDESKLVFDKICRSLVSFPKRVEVDLVKVDYQNVHCPGVFVSDQKRGG